MPTVTRPAGGSMKRKPLKPGVSRSGLALRGKATAVLDIQGPEPTLMELVEVKVSADTGKLLEANQAAVDSTWEQICKAAGEAKPVLACPCAYAATRAWMYHEHPLYPDGWLPFERTTYERAGVPVPPMTDQSVDLLACIVDGKQAAVLEHVRACTRPHPPGVLCLPQALVTCPVPATSVEMRSSDSARNMLQAYVHGIQQASGVVPNARPCIHLVMAARTRMWPNGMAPIEKRLLKRAGCKPARYDAGHEMVHWFQNPDRHSAEIGNHLRTCMDLALPDDWPVLALCPDGAMRPHSIELPAKPGGSARYGWDTPVWS